MKQLACSLLALALANCARADLFLYEPFDVNSVGGGWAEDGDWEFTNRSETVESSCELVAEGLRFGRLVTSGGAMQIETPNGGNCSVSRQMDIQQPASGGTVWMSFVFHYEGPVDSGDWAEQEFGVRFMHADGETRTSLGETHTFQDYPLYAGQWDQDIKQGLDTNGKDPSGDIWRKPPVSGQDYLVLCAVTNLALGAWNGGKATEMRGWVLDRDSFEQLLSTGALDMNTPPSQEEFMLLLDANCVAVSSEQSWGDWGTGNFNSDDWFQLNSRVGKADTGYLVDELRMGHAYADVLPLYPANNGMRIMIR